MAKSLGKHTVHTHTQLNGRPTGTVTERRVVYQRANGTFYINWWVGGTRDVTRDNNGAFSTTHNIIQVQTVNLSKLLGKL